jgi:uncharacterized membrane protein
MTESFLPSQSAVYEESPVVNGGRQPELDIARGLSVVFMVSVHFFQEYAAPHVDRSVLGTIFLYLAGPPVAPVFMFLMGAGTVYSRRQRLGQQLLRGIRLIGLGYLLSLIASVLPIAVALHTGRYAPELFFHKFRDLSAFALQINILHFAGLALMFLALCRSMRIGWNWYPLIALAVSMQAPFLWGHYTGNAVLNFLIEPLWGDRIWVRFPLYGWVVYPLMGAWFGSRLQRTTDKRSFYFTMLKLGAAGIAAGLGIAMLFGRFSLLSNLDAYYKRHSIEGHCCILSFVVIWISALFFIGRMLPSIITARLAFWSRQVTVIYAIHSLLIGWGILFLRAYRLGTAAVVAGIMLLLVTVDGICRVYDRVILHYTERYRKRLI